MCAIAQQTSQYVDISQTHINSLSLKYFELTSSSGGEATVTCLPLFTLGEGGGHIFVFLLLMPPLISAEIAITDKYYVHRREDEI